jgi:hypothetical protein
VTGLARRAPALAGLLAVAALLVVGAAGLSGHLVDDDHCSGFLVEEGTGVRGEHRWAPPGVECVVAGPPGASPSATDEAQRRGRVGSWPAFLGTLLAGLGVVGLARARRPAGPPGLRLAAATTLAFAAAGAGALVGGWPASVFVGAALGVPVAFVADRRLRPDHRARSRWPAGTSGAVVALAALAVASTGWLLGLGVAAYGLTLLVVALVPAFLAGRARPLR